MSYTPEGPIITGPPVQAPDVATSILKGTYVIVTPLLVEHADVLYGNVAGTENAVLWKYLFSDPFTDIESFRKYIETLCSSTSPFFTFAILKRNADGTDEAIGMICYLNMNLAFRSIEIGNILFGPKLKRSTAATETIYLLMKHAFEDLHFLRVEWKCNTFNEPSKNAALRLGFVYEGLFRKHMVVKGRGRDTWWGSVVDDDWSGSESSKVKEAFEAWLDERNFEGGMQKRKLEDIRLELKG